MYILINYYRHGMTYDRPDLSSERAPHRDKTALSENNLRTENNTWSQVPEWAGYLDILID
jgi:hypothetical protein